MENYSFFDRDFYPTPVEVIDQMMQFSDVVGKVVLEPSAGIGNIVEWCKASGAKQVLACEINPKLRAVLSGKCEIVGDDFLKLTAEEISHVDMVVMNPPFTADEKHILHAFDIAPEGCEIVALCNSQTLENWRYGYREVLHEKIEMFGSSQYIGRVFDNAERKCDVSVSIVRLYKPRTAENEFDGFFMGEDEEPDNEASGLMRYDFVRDCVSRYCDAVRRFDDAMEQANKINELTEGIGGNSIKFGAFSTRESSYSSGTQVTKQQFKKQLQKDAWRWLLAKFNLEKYVTSSLVADINKFVEQQSNIPFTMKNIYRMVEIIIATNGNRMEQTLVDAFELICSYSAENSTAGEKWKTNSEYMVNRKFIIPYITDCWSQWSGNETSLSYTSRIEDIEKALCYLMGVDYNKIESVKRIYNPERQTFESRKYKFGELYKVGFFEIRIYKKGTGHFKFVDEKVWSRFNQEVARIKGWALPKKTTSTKKARKTDVVLQGDLF